jgi:hypothetical protein
MDSSRPGATAQQCERGQKSAGPLAGPRLSFVSLGGCTLSETVKRLDPDRFEHLRHFWRRPTLALVARPSARPLPPLPEPFRAYFEKDASKAHLDELLDCGADVIIMDLTRDLVTGVIDLGGGAFVINGLAHRRNVFRRGFRRGLRRLPAAFIAGGFRSVLRLLGSGDDGAPRKAAAPFFPRRDLRPLLRERRLR